MRVHIKTPEGMEIDKTRLVANVRAALVGEDPEAIWRLNQIPALAQLEEGVYEEGMQDLGDAYAEIVAALALPHDAGAVRVLKAIRRRIALSPGQGSLNFDAEAHPRAAAGSADPRYKPGEFTPKVVPEEPKEAEKPPLDDLYSLIGGKLAGYRGWPDPEKLKTFLTPVKNSVWRLETALDERGDTRATQEVLWRDTDRLANDLLGGTLYELQQAIRGAPEGSEQRQHLELLKANVLDHAGGTLAEGTKRYIDREMDAPVDDRTLVLAKKLQSLEKSFKKRRDQHQDAEEWAARDLVGWQHRHEEIKAEYTKKRAKLVAELERAWDTTPGATELRRRADRLVRAANLHTEVMHRREGMALDLSPTLTETEDSVRYRKAAIEVWRDGALRDRADLYSRVASREKDLTEAWMASRPKTGLGVDGTFAPQEAVQPLGKFEAGRPLSEEECEAKDLPKGARDYAPEELTWDGRELGPGVVYVGPMRDDLLAEANAMEARLQARIPEWIRATLAEKHVRREYTALPPYRAMFPDQEMFYEEERKGPLANKSNRERSGGVYVPVMKTAFTRVGNSMPVGWGGGSGSMNVEVHEYAHAIDDQLRADGTEICKTQEFQDIWNDMKPHLGWYNRDFPWELFAEGVATYTESETNRQVMHSGPPPWRRLARFYDKLFSAPAEGDLEHPTLKKSQKLLVKGRKAVSKAPVETFKPFFPEDLKAVEGKVWAPIVDTMGGEKVFTNDWIDDPRYPRPNGHGEKEE